ncbi:hypothetical protein AAAU94_08995 [Bacteroides cellulosilyticus]|uniref:hypothetical protein n=1 Tax=Bacteroides TaxID=816 RepID=UPI0011C17B99|nr:MULTISPECIES: hypothetical protein [Bacteroides]
MKNYTIIPNYASEKFSPNDLYTITGIYLTANDRYITDSTYEQIASFTGQSLSYIKDYFIPRLKDTEFCTQIQPFTMGNLKRKRYYLPKPTENFRIIKKEVLTDTNITSEEKGFTIALYCNCVNNSFNLSLSSWKFWESKIKVAKSTFYKLKKSLVSRGYLRKLEDVPENPDSGNHSEDYMLCVPWLGDVSYIEWLHQYEDNDITERNISLSDCKAASL